MITLWFDAHKTALIPFPELGGLQFLGDGGGDPAPGGFQAVGGESAPCQGLLHVGEHVCTLCKCILGLAVSDRI